MEAGREMDARVGTEIIELPNVGYYTRESATNTVWVPCEAGHTDDLFGCGQHPANLYYTRRGTREKPEGLFAVPEYSTSIAAAMDVAEKIMMDGRSISIDGYGEELIEGEVAPEMWEVEFSGLAPRPHGKSGKAAHAICLAALKAKGIEV